MLRDQADAGPSVKTTTTTTSWVYDPASICCWSPASMVHRSTSLEKTARGPSLSRSGGGAWRGLARSTHVSSTLHAIHYDPNIRLAPEGCIKVGPPAAPDRRIVRAASSLGASDSRRLWRWLPRWRSNRTFATRRVGCRPPLGSLVRHLHSPEPSGGRPAAPGGVRAKISRPATMLQGLRWCSIRLRPL